MADQPTTRLTGGGIDAAAVSARRFLDRPWRARGAVAVAAFVGYVGLGLVGQEVVKASTGLSSFWPPNGLLVGLLVLLPSRLRLWVLVAVLPGELVLDLMLGYGSRGTLGWAAANLLESSLAASIVLVVA